MNFTKLQSAGNDFILIETNGNEIDWPPIAKTICQRHFAIGADGLILMLPSKIADIGMRIFNADGSESEACGNGLRCLVRYAISKGVINKNASEVTIETITSVRKAKILTSINDKTRIQVSMGKPEFDISKIPIAILPGKEKLLDINMISDYPINIGDMELFLCFVSMGNPHAVYFQKQPVVEFPLSNIGPAIERHELFPNRTNFEVAKVIDRDSIEVRVWERGVGETLACGSGACAVAVASQVLDYTSNPVVIKQPGGTLEVDWSGTGEAFLDGPAEIVFHGDWPD
ncbi:MAG: diaminopimelate epimerase [Dehalococcoidia bacterium]|nr:MAG: diaminopimelate epimerase [Dehalococcoidia bacterium]